MPHLNISIIPRFINTDDEDNAVESNGQPAFQPTDARDILNIHHSISYGKLDKASTNVKGTVTISYNLGTDKHKCIGSIQDRKNHAVIYMLWCSDSNKHKIMRFHRNKTDALNPYGVIEKVIEYPFGWKQKERIECDLVQDNNNELLYWDDNTGPRKVNISKASILNKTRTWDLFLPKTNVFTALTLVTITALDINGNAIPTLSQTTFPFYINPGATNDDAIAQIVSQGNAVIDRLISFEGCDCVLKISTNDQRVQRITFTAVSGVQAYPTLVVPDNWYGADLIDRMFDQGKYPNPIEPSCVFGQDATKPNKVKNIVWQVRTFGVYDDNETSVLNPISLIPIDNIVCNPVLNERLNYIDINFNDATILDQKVLTIFKQVVVCVRQTNEGLWREVARLKICDFFDVDANNNAIAHYRFYNDSTGIQVPEQDVAHPYDALPRKPRALKVFKGRMIQAGMEKDAAYSKPDCVDLQFTLRFLPDPSVTYRKVTFRIRVLSQGLDDDQAGSADISPRNNFPEINEARGAIMHNKGRATLDYPFFGGLHFGFGTGQDPILVPNMEGRWEQNLPEGGWLCYPAGTDYGAVSKQINVGLPTTKDGAFIIGTGGTVNDTLWERVGQYLDASPTTRDLYSEVTLLIPDGTKFKYRLASHWCSYGDKLQKGAAFDLNNGRACHKTSTYVYGVIRGGDLGFPNTGYWSPEHEIEVEVNGADIFGGTFVILDLSRPRFDENYDTDLPICGYVYDALGSVDEDDLRKNGIPVHRAFVTNQPPTIQTQAAINTYSPFLNERQKCFTDHNGFFYFTEVGTNAWAIRAFQVNADTSLLGTCIAYAEMATYQAYSSVFNVRSGLSAFKLPTSIQDLQDAQMQAAPQDLVNGLNQFLLATSSAVARNQCSTIVTGTFLDQNNVPIQGVSVVLGGGGQDVSDENGRFRFVAWGDMIGFFSLLPENNNNRQANLLFAMPKHCKATGFHQYLVNIFPFGANIGTSAPPYSPTAVYDLDTVLGSPVQLTITDPAIYKSWKGGAWYTPGIVHFDALLRQDSVSFNEDAKVYVPFMTERAVKGPALLDWAINNPCPRDAAFYQLVMRRDAVHSNYLSWVLNDVKYIISGEAITANGVTTFEYVESAFGNADANMILLDIANITDYAKKNFDTRIGYTWQKGDKIRLIRMADTSFVPQGLYEFEIISFEQPSFLVVKNTFQLFEIKPGMLVQLYTPRPVNDMDFFFERGEAFPCTAPGTTNNDYSVKTGTMKGGDTYWRNRSVPVLSDDKNIVTTYDYFMECNSVSDFYDSTDADEGRVQVYDDAVRETKRPALMRASDQFIENSKINGLNRWRALSVKELDAKDGLIISLKTPGDILHVTHENALVSVYIGRTETKNADGSSILITANDYFGTANRLQGDYGSQHAGSIAANEDFVYGFDAKRGIAWRRANNGLFKISEYKTRRHFKRYSDAEVWDCSSVYYREFELYILTIWEKRNLEMRVFSITIAPAASPGTTLIYQGVAVNPFELQLGDEIELTFTRDGITETVTTKVVGFNTSNFDNFIIKVEYLGLEIGDIVKLSLRGDGDTIAFCEPENRWTTRFSFQQDAYEQIGDEIVSWNNGVMVIHDKNVIRNNFNGVQYTSKITGVFNGDQQLKVWMAFYLDAIQDNGRNDWEFPAMSNKNGQLSRLLKNSLVPQIIKLEQYWHSEAKKDLNTAGVNNAIVNGRPLRSSELTVDLENNYTGEAVLRSINALVEISERNTK